MSQISTQENPQLHQIDLTKLNIAQLTQLKQRLDQVLNVTSNYDKCYKFIFSFTGFKFLSRLSSNIKNSSGEISEFRRKS